MTIVMMDLSYRIGLCDLTCQDLFSFRGTHEDSTDPQWPTKDNQRHNRNL